MIEKTPDDLLDRFTQEDLFASGLRVALSNLGPIGAIIGEFTTQFVPRQRLDRIADFVECLEQRIAGLEHQFKERLQEPAFSALVEEAMLAAVRTASAERKRDLAGLVKCGMLRPDLEAAEALTLVRLLEQLADAEVIVLLYYRLSLHATLGDPRPARFRAQQSDLLVFPPSMTSSQEEYRRWVVLNLYEAHLFGLGLLEEHESDRRSLRRFKISAPGMLLIDSIGKEPDGVPAPSSKA